MDRNNKKKIKKKSLSREEKISRILDKLRTFPRMVLIEKFPPQTLMKIFDKNGFERNTRIVSVDDDGNPHSKYGYPAEVKTNGTLVWYENGQIHRDNDLPAIIKNNGSLEWFQYGENVRDDLKKPVRVTSKDTLYFRFISSRFDYPEIRRTDIDFLLDSK